MKRILTSIAVLLAACATVFAQGGYQVKGVVTDAIGPVIGASVIEQGTSNGTSTGLDGDFVLTVSGPDAVIEISCIGYATQTFPAKSVPASIFLSEDTHFLDEVVVIGYGTVKKNDMTGSVVAIKNDEINRGAVSSPSQAMMGKVSGLRVTPASGAPGEGATIRIRGAASLNANNDPLIVIDGVPITREGGAGMGDPLASVNPNDIESFSVLKDASATAIYGSRASNGVIIITTKKGTRGALKVTADLSYSVKQNTGGIGMMTGDQFRSYVAENYGEDSNEYGMLTPGNNTDWQKQIFRLASGADYNFSVLGGDKLPFRVSFGFNGDQATLKRGSNDRYNLDLNLSPKFFQDHLTVNANVKGIYQFTEWTQGGAIGSAMSMDPTKPVKNADGTYFNWLSGGLPNSMAGKNPLSQIYEFDNFNISLRSIGNLQLDYRVHGFEDLRFNLNLGYDVSRNYNENHNVLGTFMAACSTPDYAYQSVNRNMNTLLEFYTDYNHEFKNSNLDVMAGYSWQHNYVKYDGSTYYNANPLWQSKDLFEVSPTSAKEYYLVSFFGRVNYSLMSRFLFTATLRADGSSRFAKGNQWGLFPSAAFAWNIANEPFLKNVEALSALKLRLGWGRTGQQDIGDDYYPAQALYRQETTVLMQYDMGGGNIVNVLAPQAYNKNLKWETTETWNLGLDWGLFHDRFTGTAEVYYRHTFDLLNVAPTALGQNFSNTTIQNIGDMVNKGVELTMNVVAIEKPDFHWSVGGNVTFQDTQITKLTAEKSEGFLGTTTGTSMGSNTGFSSVHREGFSPYTFYLFEQLYDRQGNPIENALVDRNGNGIIDDGDRYVTGYSPIPWMYFGVNTHLSWKKWDFSINGHGSIGNYAINKVQKGFCSSGYLPDQTGKGYINNLSSQYLIPGWTAVPSSNQDYSDLWVQNASFFKIDDINLGYTFDLDKWWAKSIRVAGSVQNVCTFTKYNGVDPELTAQDGVDTSIIPRPRLYTVRVNINF